MQTIYYYVYLQAKQLRANKREEMLKEKRRIGKRDSPPQAVVCSLSNLFS